MGPRRWRSRWERSPCMRKVECSNPSCNRPNSLKRVVTAPVPNARQQAWVSRVPGDSHYKQIGLSRKGTLTDQWPWGQNLQPFTGNSDVSLWGANLHPFIGNSDVSLWVKNSWVGRKPSLANKRAYGNGLKSFGSVEAWIRASNLGHAPRVVKQSILILWVFYQICIWKKIRIENKFHFT